MKKLISKNPVELFKTGIRFAKGGTPLNMSKLYRRSDGTYTTVDGTVVGYWKGKRLGISGLAWEYLAGKYGKKYANNANANMVNGNIYQNGQWRANYEPSGNKTADWKTATGGKTPTSFKDKRDKNRTVNFNIPREQKSLLKTSPSQGSTTVIRKGNNPTQNLTISNNSNLLTLGQFLRIAAARKAEIKQNNNGNYYFDTTLWYPSRKSLQLRIFANGDIYNLSTGQLEDTNKLIRSEYVDRTMPQIATTGWGAKRYRDSQGNIVDSNGDIVYSYEEQKIRPYTIYGRKPGGFGHITIDPEIGLNYYSNPQDNTETYLNNPGLFTLYKKGGKIKVKMADGSGTIIIDTPDKDQLAGRKPVGKDKFGRRLYLDGEGKVGYAEDSKHEQTNWMKKGGITKHQRGAKFMGTGVQRGWTSSYGNNLWNGITADLKLALIGTGKFTEDSFKDARSLQTALNNYFAGNAATMKNRDFTDSRIAVDNKWGDQSLKALMHALSMASYDKARPLNVSNVNPVNAPLNGMSTIPTKIETRPEHMYNRAEVRQLLRNQGINPYSLSGALRQAIRFALNGGHKYNKALLQGIDLKKLTQPVTVGNKETSTFNTLSVSNPGTILANQGTVPTNNIPLPTIQIKDPGRIPTVPVAKLGGRLISKDPVKLFKLGGSIAKYGLGDRMLSYIRNKKSELNRAKAAANNWSGYELTYPVFTQNGIATKGVISGNYYLPEVTVTANKEGARKARLTEASQRNASLAKMQDTLFRIGAYDRNKTLYRQAVDGLMGGLTRNAIKRAREMGYEVNEKTGEIKNLNRKAVKRPVKNPRKNNVFEMLYTPGTTPNYVLKIMNDQGQQIAFVNPALALLNRKLHGVLRINANYTAIPEDLREILSDQNLYIYDNWSTVFSNNLSVARNTLSTNLAALAKAKKENNTKEIEKLTKEIENNKKSIETISNNYNEVRKAGGLEKWLKANPGKKMIIGANFAHYKRANMSRFPQGTPSGYANFDKPNYINYAMKTPLGKVENIFGNNVQSFMYDPEQDVILTRASDTYNFNPRGSSAEGPTVSKLREAVGNDKTYTDNGSVKYSFDLKPIRPGKSNYTTHFGESQPDDSAFSKALVGLGIKLHQ